MWPLFTLWSLLCAVLLQQSTTAAVNGTNITAESRNVVSFAVPAPGPVGVPIAGPIPFAGPPPIPIPVVSPYFVMAPQPPPPIPLIKPPEPPEKEITIKFIVLLILVCMFGLVFFGGCLAAVGIIIQSRDKANKNAIERSRAYQLEAIYFSQGGSPRDKYRRSKKTSVRGERYK